MAGLGAWNALNPSSGSHLASWLDRLTPPPNSFRCGVRVLTGTVLGERARWTFRISGVDEYRVDGVSDLNHGVRTPLRVRLDRQPVRGKDRRHYGHVVLAGTEVDANARIELSVPIDDLYRFGVEL